MKANTTQPAPAPTAAAASKNLCCKPPTALRDAFLKRVEDTGISVNAYLTWLIEQHMASDQGQPANGVPEQAQATPTANRPSRSDALLASIFEMVEDTHTQALVLAELVSDRLPLPDDEEAAILSEAEKQVLISDFCVALQREAVVIPFPAVPGAKKVADGFASIFGKTASPAVIELMEYLITEALVGVLGNHKALTKENLELVRSGEEEFLQWKKGLSRGEYEKICQAAKPFNPETVKLEAAA